SPGPREPRALRPPRASSGDYTRAPAEPATAHRLPKTPVAPDPRRTGSHPTKRRPMGEPDGPPWAGGGRVPARHRQRRGTARDAGPARPGVLVPEGVRPP